MATTIRYEPVKDNLYKMRMVMRLQANATFKNVFKYDLTEHFIADLRSITDEARAFRQNTVINLSGMSGSGKSLIAMTIGKMAFKSFTHKNMFFFDQEILDNASKFPPNNLLIRDENPQKAIFGMGSIRTSQQLGVMAETCRKYGLSIMYIEPSFVQDSVSKILIETVDMDTKHRITRCALRDTYTLGYMGAIYIPVLQESDLDWIEYNKRKDKFIDDMRHGKLTGAKMDYNQCVDEIIAKIERNCNRYRNKVERKALIRSMFPTYTNGEVNFISTLLEIEIREGEEEDVGDTTIETG